MNRVWNRNIIGIVNKIEKRYRSAIYFDINTQKNEKEWNYEKASFNHYGYLFYIIHIRLSDDYDVVRRIGKGKFSEVFEGVDILKNQKVIVKMLKPTKQERIEREIMILQKVQGHPNVQKLIDIVREENSKIISYIHEYIEVKDDTRIVFKSISEEDLKHYMR